jgi:hypothetical protein
MITGHWKDSYDGSLERLWWWVTEKAMMMGYWKVQSVKNPLMLTNHWKVWWGLLKRLWWWVIENAMRLMGHWKGYDDRSLNNVVAEKVIDVDQSLKSLWWWVSEKAMMMTGHWKVASLNKPMMLTNHWKVYDDGSLKRLWWWVTEKTMMMGHWKVQ